MLEKRIDIWKTNIETQKHFNDLIIRIRERAITVLGAGLVAAAFLVKDGYTLLEPIRYIHLLIPVAISVIVYVVLWVYRWMAKKVKSFNYFFLLIVGVSISTLFIYNLVRVKARNDSSGIYAHIIENPSLAGVLLLAIAFVWIIFYVMDRLWYHRLLKGSVDANIDIENAIMAEISSPGGNSLAIPNMPTGIGQSITNSSTVKFSILPVKLDSTAKIDIFYSSVFMGLLLIALLLFKSADIIHQNNQDINTVAKDYQLKIDNKDRSIDSLRMELKKVQSNLNKLDIK